MDAGREDASARFERVAEIFYRATGHMAPGKDDPLCRDREPRESLWLAFIAGRQSGLNERATLVEEAYREGVGDAELEHDTYYRMSDGGIQAAWEASDARRALTPPEEGVK